MRNWWVYEGVDPRGRDLVLPGRVHSPAEQSVLADNKPSLVNMRFLSSSFALIGLARLAAAAEPVVLEPVPRYVWDPSVAASLDKRQDPAATAANVSLTDYEELVWTTPPGRKCIEVPACAAP